MAKTKKNAAAVALGSMKLNVAYQVKPGGRISYNDGRPGHEGVEATVLAVDAQGMTVQFDDGRIRPTSCSPTRGGCSLSRWFSHLV